MHRVLILLFIIIQAPDLQAQRLIKAEELINGNESYAAGTVEIQQDIRVDSLLSRHILANSGVKGIEGYRISIFRGSGRDARERANDTKAEFISEFPDIPSYLDFDPPNYFKVRVGDYRNRHEAYPDFIRIKKKFPNSFIGPDLINYPDLEK